MTLQKVGKDYIDNGLKGNTMRKYTVKDEEDLIRQIESDPEFDKGWEQVVEGHVVEIKYIGKKESTGIKKPKTTPVGAGI